MHDVKEVQEAVGDRWDARKPTMPVLMVLFLEYLLTVLCAFLRMRCVKGIKDIDSKPFANAPPCLRLPGDMFGWWRSCSGGALCCLDFVVFFNF